jgi:hypothetical protein
VAEGAAELQRWIAKLHDLEQLPQRVAPLVAKALEQELLHNVARGVGPDGVAWPRTKDGHLPLQHTGRELTVRAVGTSIVARLVGVHALHHRGAVRGGVRRPILPSSALPEPMVRAIRNVITAALARTMESTS